MRGIMHRWGRLIGCCGLLGLGWVAAHVAPTLFAQDARPAVAPRLAQATPAGKNQPLPADPPATDDGIVAYVNGVPITRAELAEELIARRGREHLELMINKKIIEQAAAQANITVTDAEMEEDLRDVMRAAGCTTSREFEEKLLKERKVTIGEYKEDVVRPALLMRKLAGQRVKPTPEDLQNAFDSIYGEKIEVRIIMENDFNLAIKLHAQVNGKSLADFIRVASTQADYRLAATGGQTLPISRHSGLPKEIEEMAFKLKDGEVSPVMQAGKEGYVILYRVRSIPPKPGVQLIDVRDQLEREVIEKRMRVETPRLFKELQKQAKVHNFLDPRYGLDNIRAVMERPPEPSSAGGPGGR
jgi:parvulin-like peptidyl-prolyl isomerase